MLGTIDDPTSGSIEMFGHSVNKDSSDSFLADLRLNKIGFVFQTFNLLATMSAFENVELPMIMRGKLSKNESKARALELLDCQTQPDDIQWLTGFYHHIFIDQLIIALPFFLCISFKWLAFKIVTVIFRPN